MATKARPAVPSPDTFVEWLDSPFIRVASYRQHEQWYAVAEDFDVVGIGTTEGAATQEVAALVEAYLRSYHRDGLSYRAAWRPIPVRARLAYVARGFLARSLQWSHVSLPFSEEARVLLPVALGNGRS